MINSTAFTNRLQKVIDYYDETASSFAEKIGVQRSSISHLLSGRNKPSLDFVMKLLNAYPEVELYWLLKGKGEFPQSNQIDKANLLKTTSPQIEFPETEHYTAPKAENKTETETENKATFSADKSHEVIEKIVIFYTNGTFKSYKP